MLPIVHGLEADYWGEIDFVYLDHLDPINEAMLTRYQFTWRPLFIFVDAEGNEIERWFGFVPAEDFRQSFDAYLEQQSAS